MVIDGKVDETKTETVNVGGWQVSQFLKQAVVWRDNQEAAGVRGGIISLFVLCLTNLFLIY